MRLFILESAKTRTKADGGPTCKMNKLREKIRTFNNRPNLKKKHTAFVLLKN